MVIDCADTQRHTCSVIPTTPLAVGRNRQPMHCLEHDYAATPLTWRNGHRGRVLDTRLGSLQLRIPKLRQGSFFPPFLEARKVSEKALIAVIQEAWIGGVSARRVDELVQAMGLSGISKSRVSKLCKVIDRCSGTDQCSTHQGRNSLTLPLPERVGPRLRPAQKRGRGLTRTRQTPHNIPLQRYQCGRAGATRPRPRIHRRLRNAG
jgi:hypothetical protein